MVYENTDASLTPALRHSQTQSSRIAFSLALACKEDNSYLDAETL